MKKSTQLRFVSILSLGVLFALSTSMDAEAQNVRRRTRAERRMERLRQYQDRQDNEVLRRNQRNQPLYRDSQGQVVNPNANKSPQEQEMIQRSQPTWTWTQPHPNDTLDYRTRDGSTNRTGFP